MMYNDVDNDLPPFNDTIDGEEIFLFSNTKTSSTGASFLHEDDDDHLRHQHNVVAGTSSHHIPVDVDELLLNSNFLEQPNCDQSEDPLFWNCKDISDDQLNEFLPTTHLHLNSNNLSNNHHCVNPTTIATTTNFANNGSSNNINTQQHGIVISQQQPQTQNITHIQHSQTIIPIQSHHQLQHHTIAPLLSQSQLINHQHQIHQIRLQQPDPNTQQQQTNTSVSDQSHQQQQPSQVQVQQGFQAPQQIIQHVDQYQSKWITLVQTNDSYQNFNPQPPQQQHQQAQIFFDKIPQTLVQTDIGSSIIQNPVSSVITTTSPQITIQQQPPAQSQHQVQSTQQQAKPTQQQPVHQHQQQQNQQLLSTVVQTQQTQLSSQSGISNQEQNVTKTVSPNAGDAPKKEASTTKPNKPKEKQTRLDCPYCKRSFSKNFDLQQHMRCHTGEKPFQCIVCGRGFAQKSNVKKHMQAHKVWPEGPNNPPMPLNHSSARSRNNSASSSRDDECMQENDALQINDNNNNNMNNGTTTTLGLSNDRKNEGNDIFAENRYSCSYCPFNGRTYFELKSHLTVHKREKVFKCIVSSCGKTFSGADLQGFLDHVTGHKDLIYHCHLCSGQFYSLDEFGEHQKHHSNAQMKRTTQSQLPPSNQPQATLSNRNSNTSLRQQNQQVTTPTQLQPQQNQRQYNQQHATPAHQQQVNSSNQKSVKIFNNSSNSTTVSSNNNHSHNNNTNTNNTSSNSTSSRSKNNNQKYFRCSKCMNRYTTQTALDHHLSISTHNFPCTECNKVFMCERYLRRHLNTHTAVQHVCTFCDKHFKTAAYLKMHSVVHTGEKPFRCNQCEAAFNRRDKLNRHKLTHETIKKFKCPFRPHVGCTKEFNRPDKLKAHVLTHSGVRPHPCDSCSRTFSRLSRLREHRRLQHDNSNRNNNSSINITSNDAGINNDNNVTTSRQQVNLQTSETLKTDQQQHQQQPQQQFEKNVAQIVVGFDSMSCVNVNSDIVVGITGGSV